MNPPLPARHPVVFAVFLAAMTLPAWRARSVSPSRLPTSVARTEAEVLAGVYGRGEVTLASSGRAPVILGPDSWFYAFEYAPDGTAAFRYEAVRLGNGPTRTLVFVDGRRVAAGDGVVSRVRRVADDLGYPERLTGGVASSGAIVPGGIHENSRRCGLTLGVWTHGMPGAPDAPGGYFGARGFVGIFVHQVNAGNTVRYYEVLGGGPGRRRMTVSRDAVPGQVNPDERVLLEELTACVMHARSVELEAQKAKRRG